ncbi:ectonucleotide pyrophosphatase/phosphodiesterase family member 7-like [Mugil cephalus]|uniref:ectonucleotide pyrophosphatase/phosphodiesterase family member 7-like n=1 Tax=Mugil cephalus TaxID=48193 RepID=UPI001FB60E9B|nr:ectonucleotide pyrophosphatase/phosphodiesterase family member 7-like [Mugil cephalus]
MIIDFHKTRQLSHSPLLIVTEEVETVLCFKFLGVTMTEDLSWGKNIASAIAMAQQRLFYLRKLKQVNRPQRLLTNFYHRAVESVLTYGLLVQQLHQGGQGKPPQGGQSCYEDHWDQPPRDQQSDRFSAGMHCKDRQTMGPFKKISRRGRRRSQEVNAGVNSVIFLLFLPVLCLIGNAPSTAAAPWDTTGPGSTRNKLLLISFDGFRWDYDQDVDTPNLDKMAQDGVKAKYVTPPFLTFTSPTHFTVLTGRRIENYGEIRNIFFKTSTTEKKPNYVTQFVETYPDNGSLPIWITAQRQGLKAGSLHFPGTAATYNGEFVKVRQVELHFYDYSNETDCKLNIDKVMGEWFHQQNLDFVSLYFGEPHGIGHKYGPDSSERRAMVRQVDRTVGYIRDKTKDHGLTDRLNIIITADHGMTRVLRGGEVNEIILSKISGFSFTDIKLHLGDYGPAMMLLPKNGMLEKVYQALDGSHPHLHVLKKEEMPTRLQYSKHPRLLPIILLADPGYVISWMQM